MVYAVIAAGGTGIRAKKELPKQFIEVCGKPIVIHTLEKFEAVKEFRRIILLCPEEWTEYAKKLVDSHFEKSFIKVISGGQTRNDTIMKAIDFIAETDGLTDDTVIVTHDAVRPLVTGDIIRNHIDTIPFCDAIGTVIPATDTVIISKDGKKVKSVTDRGNVFQCQTPQTFRAKRLKMLYNSLSENQKKALTDTCSIFTVSGEEVRLVAGEASNFKITYPTDLKIAEALLK